MECVHLPQELLDVYMKHLTTHADRLFEVIVGEKSSILSCPRCSRCNRPYRLEEYKQAGLDEASLIVQLAEVSDLLKTAGNLAPDVWKDLQYIDQPPCFVQVPLAVPFPDLQIGYIQREVPPEVQKLEEQLLPMIGLGYVLLFTRKPVESHHLTKLYVHLLLSPQTVLHPRREAGDSALRGGLEQHSDPYRKPRRKQGATGGDQGAECRVSASSTVKCN
jgi:hypothetical protein